MLKFIETAAVVKVKIGILTKIPRTIEAIEKHKKMLQQSFFFENLFLFENRNEMKNSQLFYDSVFGNEMIFQNI